MSKSTYVIVAIVGLGVAAVVNAKLAEKIVKRI